MCAKKIQIRVFILLVYTDYIVTKSWYIVIKKCRNPGEDGERHKANQGKSLRCFNGDLGKFDCMKLWFLLLSFTAQEVCNGRPGRHFYLVLVTFPLLFGNRFFFFQGAGVRMKMHEHVGTCMNIYEYVWIGRNKYKNARTCMNMQEDVWTRKKMYEHVWTWICMNMWIFGCMQCIHVLFIYKF